MDSATLWGIFFVLVLLYVLRRLVFAALVVALKLAVLGAGVFASVVVYREFGTTVLGLTGMAIALGAALLVLKSMASTASSGKSTSSPSAAPSPSPQSGRTLCPQCHGTGRVRCNDSIHTRNFVTDQEAMWHRTFCMNGMTWCRRCKRTIVRGPTGYID